MMNDIPTYVELYVPAFQPQQILFSLRNYYNFTCKHKYRAK